MTKNNIKKVLLYVSYTMILLVYCSLVDVKVAKAEVITEQNVEMARMYNTNFPIQIKEHVDDILENKLIFWVNYEVNTGLSIQKRIDLSDSDVRLLERLVMGEAEGESLEGKIAVAKVILNRMNAWSKSLKEIVYQRVDNDVQFSCTADGRIDLKPSDECIEAVKLLLNGEKTKITDDTLYFYAPNGCKSTWHENKLEFVVEIGGHRFFREKK